MNRARLRTVGVVAFGGVVGAAARWGVTEVLVHRPHGWPLATFVVNVVGCVLIGLAARHLEPHTLVWAGVVTGVLGGFTTMSTLAVELNELADTGRTGVAIAYAVGTIAAGWSATALASRPARAIERAGYDA